MTNFKLWHLKNDRIRTRLIALLFACNLIPLLSILQIIDQITGNFDDPDTAIELDR